MIKKNSKAIYFELIRPIQIDTDKFRILTLKINTKEIECQNYMSLILTITLP